MPSPMPLFYLGHHNPCIYLLQAYSFNVMVLTTTILKFTSRNNKNRDWLGAQGAAIPTLSSLLGVFGSDSGTTAVSKREVCDDVERIARVCLLTNYQFSSETLQQKSTYPHAYPHHLHPHAGCASDGADYWHST